MAKTQGIDGFTIYEATHFRERVKYALGRLARHGWGQGYDRESGHLKPAEGRVCLRGAMIYDQEFEARQLLQSLPPDSPLFKVNYSLEYSIYRFLDRTLGHYILQTGRFHVCNTYGEEKYASITSWNDVSSRKPEEVTELLVEILTLLNSRINDWPRWLEQQKQLAVTEAPEKPAEPAMVSAPDF